MKRQRMTLASRSELLDAYRPLYSEANLDGKTEVLTAFVNATGYSRKHATNLLNGRLGLQRKAGSGRQKKFAKEETAAITAAWHLASRICAKRLAPFLPELLTELEKAGQLQLPPEVRANLVKVSASTIDRVLREERRRLGRSLSTTKRGVALRSQIPLRTFTEWDGVTPGYFEVDTVSHCASSGTGQFLSTLNMTDIVTCWTEPLALLRKGAIDVIAAFDKAAVLLPFPILGVDSDNGSEFINAAFIEWCKDRNVNQTRSREYKKNDQAWIEEKNRSVVRKHVGRDRLEGEETWQELSEYYSLLRLYFNFFQPCQKLVLKRRNGSKVYKKHDIARTPYQRVLENEHLSNELKAALVRQKEELSMVAILKKLEHHRSRLNQLAVDMPDPAIAMLANQRMSTHQFVDKLHQKPSSSDSVEANTMKILRTTRASSPVMRPLRNMIENLPTGTRVRPKDINGLGSPDTLAKCFERLVKTNHLKRVGWGRYEVLPGGRVHQQAAALSHQV